MNKGFVASLALALSVQDSECLVGSNCSVGLGPAIQAANLDLSNGKFYMFLRFHCFTDVGRFGVAKGAWKGVCGRF